MAINTSRVLPALGAALFATTTIAGPSAAPAHAETAAAGKTAWLVFDKNQSDPTRSELRLTVLKDGKAIKTLHYRAGAGDGSKDPCAKNRGWLPNGRYDMKMYGSYPGTTIRGRALWLSNKACSNGTKRTELFVHTSTPWTANRYYSNGCIKLSNAAIDTMYRTLRYHFPSVGEGQKLPFQLKVVD